MADINSILTVEGLQAENARLNKIIRALMNRVERSSSRSRSNFDQFQATIMLEERVRRRTLELEAALAENQTINRALREAEQKFHRVLDQSLVGITLTIDYRIHYANPKFAEMLGYTEEEIQTLSPDNIITPENLPYVHDIIAQTLAGEFKQITFITKAICKDKRIIDVEVSGSQPIDIGGQPGLIAVWIDITERLRAERELKALQMRLLELANHDPLTGLHNRLFLDENLQREIDRAQRSGHIVSAIMLDLDFFKAVNDGFGHLAGDAALKHLAGLLKQHSRSSDIVCRFGGEEFFMLLSGTCIDVARERAESLRQALKAEPVVWQDLVISLTASFGIAAYPDSAQTGIDLISMADKALYISKSEGRDRVTCYTG